MFDLKLLGFFSFSGDVLFLAGRSSSSLCAELVEMDVLSKVNPETHMQIVEQMKRVLR